MSISKHSSRDISTRAARLRHNFGICPDIREMPPLMRYSHWSMDLTSYYQLWGEVARLHDLESRDSPLSVWWPPGLRLMVTSLHDPQRHYET